MKVSNLIQMLQLMDPDAMVVVRGYEGGYKDVDCASNVKLALNVHKEWYYGRHEEAEFVDNYSGPVTDAVLIA